MTSLNGMCSLSRDPNVIFPQRQFQGTWTAENADLQSNLLDLCKSPHLSLWAKISTIFNRIMECIARCLSLGLLHNRVKDLVVPSSTFSEEDIDQTRKQWARRWGLQSDDDMALQTQPSHDPSQQHNLTISDDVEWDESAFLHKIRLDDARTFQKLQLASCYQPQQLKLTTPDGVEVEGIFYKDIRSDSNNIPTIICCNPNAALAHEGVWDWLLLEGRNDSQPFNVLTYDYITPQLNSARDLVVYGDTLFQAALSFDISEQNVHFLGYSLGGPIAAKIADMHPYTGRVVSLRSFASMEHFLIDPQGIVAENLPFYCIRWVLAKINTAIGWGIEAADALWNLRNRTLFVYTPQDEIFAPSAAAVSAVGEANLSRDRCIVMQVKEGITVGNHHCDELSKFEDAQGNSIAQRIVRFILTGSSVLNN